MSTANKLDPDQSFEQTEQLFRRVKPIHMQNGRATFAGIKATLTYPEKSGGENRHLASPSSVRGKYSTAEDARQPYCAGGRPDVTNDAVISIRVSDLPKNFATQMGRSYDFYPFHQPLPECLGHTLIHSCLAEHDSPAYDDPTQDAKNELRARFYQRQVVHFLPVE